MIRIPIAPPTTSLIVKLNEMICTEGKNPHQVLNSDRVESAIHSAFYPGSPPFVYGGIAKIAGALCYFLTKGHAFQDGNKRTAVLAALSFMNKHGWDLVYPLGTDETQDALAELVDGTAAGKFSKEDMVNWFENHKRLIEDA